MGRAGYQNTSGGGDNRRYYQPQEPTTLQARLNVPYQPQGPVQHTNLGSSYNPATFGGGGNFRNGTAGSGIGTGSAFTEGGLLDYVAQDPSLYLNPLFDQRFGSGWSSGAGGLGGNLYGLMADQMKNANALYMLNNPSVTGGAAGFEGFLSNFANSRMTPGQFTDVGGLMGALNSPTGTLASYLFAGGDAQGQAQAYMNLARGLASQGMHPMVAEAYLNDVGMRMKEYLAATAQGRALSGGPSSFAAGRSGMY
jgi:hypothetical protein